MKGAKPVSGISRRQFLRAGAAGGLAAITLDSKSLALDGPSTLKQPINQRSIPSTEELIPVVGLGTWRTFDVGASTAARAPLKDVLRLFAERGGRLVDSSPMYGRAESVVGDLSRDLGLSNDLFFATKVWTEGRASGIRQVKDSMDRMRADPLDLMQVHNLVDVDAHLGPLRELKQEGSIRYLGITHYQVHAYARLEALIRSESLDFVQFNYSVATRESERTLLKLAADQGTAVVVNRPFEGGSLFRQVRGRELPEWSAAFECDTWGQFFLKYILAAEEVTCVIPATADPKHVVDNVSAGFGPLPNVATRKRMVEELR